MVRHDFGIFGISQLDIVNIHLYLSALPDGDQAHVIAVIVARCRESDGRVVEEVKITSLMTSTTSQGEHERFLLDVALKN